jgi:hypothetical protein
MTFWTLRNFLHQVPSSFHIRVGRGPSRLAIPRTGGIGRKSQHRQQRRKQQNLRPSNPVHIILKSHAQFCAAPTLSATQI